MNPFSPAFYIWRLPAVLGTLATNETIVYLLAIDYPVPILVVPPVRVTRIARTPPLFRSDFDDILHILGGKRVIV